MRGGTTIVALILCCTAAGGEGEAPQRWLWAWERPEDLRFVAGSGDGVALLLATVELRGDGASTRWRRNPAQIAPGTPLVAVVRLEQRGVAPRALSAIQERHVVEALATAARPA